MQNQVGIPQKDRGRIVDAVFNKEGVTNTDDSIVTDNAVAITTATAMATAITTYCYYLCL